MTLGRKLTNSVPRPGWTRMGRFVTSLFAGLLLLTAFFGNGALHSVPARASGGIHNIEHVIVIMQENRSFDEYFGMYPGADGLVQSPGVINCNPDPVTKNCILPYHDSRDANMGGGHGPLSLVPDVDGGKMDGYVGQFYKHWNQTTCSPVPATGTCSDVMGYKDRGDIPNYWSYADNFVLQDHMFESVPSWSRTSHVASDHAAGALVSDDQAYVTSLVNAVMGGPSWNSTAIFVSWDDWGGFYDHVKPPSLGGGDVNGLGFRVPGLVVSPYAKTGYID